MARGAFDGEVAKRAVTEAVRAAEARTAAEIVVAIRPSSGRYLDADLVAGAVAGLATLCVLLLIPQPITTDLFPLLVAAGFGIGALAWQVLAPIRRALLRERRMREQVRLAARDLFFERGVGHTGGRTGVLLLVSRFERMLGVAADVGVDLDRLSATGREALRDLEGAIATDDLSRFVAALEAFGRALGELVPHSARDLNELSDAPDDAA